MMKKLPLILGLTAGSIALLLLSVFLMLAIQGKLDSVTLTRMPILGRFFGEPVPVYIQPPQQQDKDKAKEEAKDKEAAHVEKEPTVPSGRFNFPSPYNAQDLTQLVMELTEGKEHNQKKDEELRAREEDIARREKDLEQRTNELNQLAAKIEEVRSKIETDLKSVKDGRSNMDADEKEAIQRIAEWCKVTKAIAPIVVLIERLGELKAVKILDELSADEEGNQKASTIITQLKPEFATKVMELMIKRKKAGTVATNK